MAAWSGSVQSSAMKPSVAVCPVRSSRADSLRRKPRSAIAPCTRLAVSGVTPASPFTTRDTVFSATPALDATSFIVGRPTLCTASTCLFIGPPGNSLLSTGPPDTCRGEEYDPGAKPGTVRHDGFEALGNHHQRAYGPKDAVTGSVAR